MDYSMCKAVGFFVSILPVLILACVFIRGIHNVLRFMDDLAKRDIMDREPTPEEINSACMYYRHDFGLLDGIEQHNMLQRALDWQRAWRKVQEDFELRAGKC